MPRITEMFAFVTSDSEPDDEGIIGTNTTTHGWLPFVGANWARVDDLRPVAASIATTLGKEVRILRFAGPPEVVETLKPEAGRPARPS